MTKFAMLNAEGFATAFYDRDMHGNDIPTGVIEITDEQWLEYIDNQGRRKFADGQLVEFVPPPPQPIIPDRVSSRQFFMMLDKMDATTNPGIYDQVDGWVASQPRAIRLVYEKAGSFVRTDEMLQQGFTSLGFTPEQVDAFFMAAAAL